ncbi:MAG: HPr family phosphocarrier protein [Fluviibacter sp.]|jgi:phosphocarrier protein HPr|nr:HPr family phosphocarrier protein [Rhodocyclales bacterium]
MTTLRQDVEIINKLGLHARASAKFTQLAGTFQSEVWLERNGRRVNGKSIMGVMMLAAGKGTSVTIETIGDDAEAAMTGLVGLINDYFGEGE